MKRYQIKVLTLLFLMSGLVLQFQNCGSKAGSDSAYSADEALQGDDLSLINEVSTGGIQFTKSKTVLSSVDDSVIVYGTCSTEHENAILSWQLLDNHGQLVFKGKSVCSKGIFEVAFEGAQDVACDAQLVLKAVFGAQAKTETLIQKKCQ